MLVTLLLVLSLYFSTLIFAETIVLKSGKTVEGKIIEKTDRYIKVDFHGVELIFWLDEINRINGDITFDSEKSGRGILLKQSVLAVETPEELLYKGIDYYNKGLFDEALNNYKKALSLRPKYGVALFNMGIVYAKKDQWKDCINVLRDLVELNPLDAEAHLNLATAYAAIEKYTDAFKHYEKCRELNFSRIDPAFVKLMESFRHREYDFLYQPLLDKTDKEVIIKIGGNPQGADILFRDVIRNLESLESVSDKGIFKEINIEFISGKMRSHSGFSRKPTATT